MLLYLGVGVRIAYSDKRGNARPGVWDKQMFEAHTFCIYTSTFILLMPVWAYWHLLVGVIWPKLKKYNNMESKMTLKELFESRKEELTQKLIDLSLPQDATKVQTIVANYLNQLFDSNGDFRQNLTQSEDYILQAAMSLLNAQQAMVSEFSEASKINSANQTNSKKVESSNSTVAASPGIKKEMFPYAIGATAIGGAVGGLVLSTWGALFGSIAGTALVLYYASQKEQPKQKEPERTKPVETPTVKKLDVDRFTAIISNICGSVDSLIQTFRVQINRVVEKYENQEKPVLEKEYGVLLDSVQSLLGASCQPMDDKWLKRVKSRIEELAESLENYNLEVVMYDESNSQYFEVVETENMSSPTISLPAIIKKGTVIRKGKVLINKSV